MENAKENLEKLIDLLFNEFEKHKLTGDRKILNKIYRRYEDYQQEYFKKYGYFRQTKHL